ncbi:MAG: lecithin retinol acyltransferase family protein [Spirochaetia bacterium]|nr:lecithin retinol acyltransferase family protein [bacterium]MBR0318417.1 lecithin retinol acyltransferase family protein [Spirochaetia bacterium]
MNKKTIDQIPQPGDVIYVHRKWKGIPAYKHYGVFIGYDGTLKDQVIHFRGKEKDIAFSEADIIQTSLEDFLKDGELKIQKRDLKGWEPFPTEEIIRKAKLHCGEKRGTYDLLYNNCEHFANECRFGRHYSLQQKLAEGAKNTFVFIAGVVVTIGGKALVEKFTGEKTDRT